MLGITRGRTPKFAKHFGEIGDAMLEAFNSYASEVKATSYPAVEQTYVKSDCDEYFLKKLDEKYA